MPRHGGPRTSIGKTGSTSLTGIITLSQGSGVTLTQSGQDISIAASAGSGDVVGPSSATASAVALFDGTTGKLLKSQGYIVADTANTELGIGTTSPGATLEIVRPRYVNTNCIQLRTDDAALFSGTGVLRLNAAEDSGYTTIAGFNSAGTAIRGFSADAGTEYGSIFFKSTATEFSTGSTTRPTLTMKAKASQTAPLFELADSAGTSIIKFKPFNAAVDARMYFLIGHLASLTPGYKLQIISERYNNSEAFAMITSDGNGAYGSGTGSFRFCPAADSGLSRFELACTDGHDLQYWNSTGATLYAQLRTNSTGMTITNGSTGVVQFTIKGTASQTAKLFRCITSGSVEKFAVDTTGVGFYATTPVAQQTSTAGAVTAGALYTAQEQAMLTDVYAAMRAYGLLT